MISFEKMEVEQPNVASHMPPEVEKDNDGAMERSPLSERKVNIVSEQKVCESGEAGGPKDEPTDAPKLTLETPVEDIKEPAPPLLVPSLKGKMTYEGGAVTCKGVWGMSDDAHNQPGQTSNFEFKLIQRDEGSKMFPVDGLYQGWFAIKQLAPNKTLKVDDKEMRFKFTALENGAYNIDGRGINKFGSFNLKGTLSEEGDVHVYREYYNLNPAPLSATRRTSGTTPRATPRATPRQAADKKKQFLSIENPDEAADNAAASAAAAALDASGQVEEPQISPRESGRVRRQSFAMREYQEMKSTSTTPRTPAGGAGGSSSFSSSSSSSGGKQGGKQGKEAASSSGHLAAAVKREESGGGIERSQRLSHPMKKCMELLKEMSKHPQSQWFLEPVDYLRLNIPDYPKIVKNPMDFSTVRSKIQANKYDAHNDFADDMRLVFRNAITFNTAADSVVHIAAKEMAGRFEDRYRVLTTQLGGVSVYSAATAAAVEAPNKSVRFGSSSAAGAGSGAGNKNKKSGAGKSSSGQSGAARQKSSSASTAGPRPAAAAAVATAPHVRHHAGAAPVADASAHQIAELFRLVHTMQGELDELRSMVRQQQIVEKVYESRDAAQNPLSLDEKQSLISAIHKLPPDHMEQVLEIIQEAMPDSGADGGEVEIPLDALDTLTMRRLQKFIQDNTRQKKRNSGLHRTTSANGAKRQRKQKSTDGTGTAAGGGGGGGISDMGDMAGYYQMGASSEGQMEQGYAHEQEELLFPSESFDDLRSAPTQQHPNATNGPDSAGDALASYAQNGAPAAPSVETATANGAVNSSYSAFGNGGGGDGVGDDASATQLMPPQENSGAGFGSPGSFQQQRARAGSVDDEDFSALVAMKQSPGGWNA